MTSTTAGVCAIKEEFVIKRPANVSDSDNHNLLGKRKLEEEPDARANHVELKNFTAGPPSQKKARNRGQNKARPKTFNHDKQSKPCPVITDIRSADKIVPCTYNNCKFIHDPVEYLKSKPKDIGDTCHLFNLRGKCPRGIACRYGSEHLSEEGYNIVNEEKFQLWKEDVKNTLQQTVLFKLQRRQYDFTFAEKLVNTLYPRNKKNFKSSDKNLDALKELQDVEERPSDNTTSDTQVEKKGMSNGENEDSSAKVKDAHAGAITDEYLIKLLPREKKSLDWKDKLYLSPLTTVGNLPFRRICKSFGADITCGEMALCESLLKGHKQEWALVKRHESEDIFGAQICGNNAYIITKTAQLLQENTELDFIDLNTGCPIDLIYKQGGGSGMMHRIPILEASVKCASTLLSIPFTVKMRTGVYNNKKIAHEVMPKVAASGASLITLHGRSREGRYTRSADWEYIETCAKAVPCPVFGNGDVLSYEDYLQRREFAPTVQGVMIGRGALIKPWIFTEIKEQRLWDIRSSERFDIIKKYRDYGLEHWGSDTQGVENTRRFLLEWLSFLYRYVPVGLLERPPQKINERPPSFFGRDDMETLMASGNCADWIKISEMLLGPVPDGFVFLPKHKANSYQ